jgi:hypothetical protein
MIIAVASVPFSSTLRAEDEAQTELTPYDSIIVKLDKYNYAVGNLTLNKETREILIPGFVNMQQGLVEYLAVTETGKRHESVLVLQVRPLHVQVALLLFGLDYGRNLEFQGDTAEPRGDLLDIEVGLINEAGDTIFYPAHNFLYDEAHQRMVEKASWIFTGSYPYEGSIVADIDGSIIATYNDPAAVINNPLEGRIDDTYYGVNSELVPDSGATIIMKITASPRKSGGRHDR